MSFWKRHLKRKGLNVEDHLNNPTKDYLNQLTYYAALKGPKMELYLKEFQEMTGIRS